MRKRGGNACDQRFPRACGVLAKQPGRRIPGAVVAIQEPSPASVVAIEQPKWLAKRAGEMRHRRVHRDNEVQILNQCGGVGKIIQVASVVDNRLTPFTVAQLPHRIVALLQTEKFAPRHLKQRRQPIECDAALAVNPIGTGQFLARIAGPYQTDPEVSHVCPAVRATPVSCPPARKDRGWWTGSSRAASRRPTAG